MGRILADASDMDDLATATDNVGPDDFPDPDQSPEAVIASDGDEDV